MELKRFLNCTNLEFCYVSDDSILFTSVIARASQIFSIIVLIILCLLGNSLLCYVVYNSVQRSSAAAILLLNLAIADILVGVLVLPMWIFSTVVLAWPLSDNICEFVAFITVVSMLCSVLSLCGIAVDRYCCIAFPLRYPVEVTVKRINFLVAMLWVYSLSIAICPLCGWGEYQFQPQTVPICNPVWVTEVTFAAFLVLLGMALPVGLMLFSYIKIVLIARDHIRRIDVMPRRIDTHSVQISTQLPNEVKEELPVSKSKFAKSLKMVQRVFIAVGAFFLCWGPYVILNFWSVNHEEKQVPYVADLLVTLLAFANSSVNPVVFIVLNKEYRQTIVALKNRIQNICPCYKNRVNSLDGEQYSPEWVSGLQRNQHPNTVDKVSKTVTLAPHESAYTPDRPLTSGYDSEDIVANEGNETAKHTVSDTLSSVEGARNNVFVRKSNQSIVRTKSFR